MSQRALGLQASGWQGVFYVTGGGSLLIPELLTTAGASKTVLEVSVPYAGQALAELLGQAPEQSCSAGTARALAMRALQRAQALGSARPFGLGCTAGLATDRARRGTDRGHVAIQTTHQSLDLRFDFSGTRKQQEAALLEGLWMALASGLDLVLPNRAATAAAQTVTKAPPAWRTLIDDSRSAVPATRAQSDSKPLLLLPGSFNPLHEGHRGMMACAQQQLGMPGAFELSIENVDKPLLDYSTIKERAAAFRGRKAAGPLWLTRLPTFVEKARCFPGATFAVGIDVITRIADAKYYDGVSGRNRALKELAELGCRFLVFGRLRADRFLTLSDVRLPATLRALCIPVEEEVFRSDISSTQLRQMASS